MKKKIRIAAIILAGVLTVGAVAVFAAQGDQSDPLITLSYLEKVLGPKLDAAVDEAVAANEEELAAQLDMAITSYETRVDEKLAASGASFLAHDLSRGDKLVLDAGRELLLVSGSATAIGTLTDTTAGTTVTDGEALTEGHLYVTTTADSGLKANGTVSAMSR